jgi:hypothetical protein
MNGETPFEVRDIRQEDRFWIDRLFIDEAAKLCGGASAIAVYASLCRHANVQQQCWPSIATIVKQTCMSERQVRYTLEALQIHALIRIEKVVNKCGKHNQYHLLDKSQWFQGGLCTPQEPGEPGKNNHNADKTPPSDVRAVIAFFRDSAHTVKGFRPAVAAKDAAAVKKALSNHSGPRIRNMISFFLSTEKATKFLSLAAALSADSINQYELTWQRTKWQWSDEPEPPVDREWWIS